MRLADMFDVVVGDAAGVEFVGYDGSRAGQIGAPVRLELRSPIALSYFASSPGQLGLARAYVAGQLEVHGDMYTALTALASLGGGQVLPTISGEQAQRRRISRATKLRMASRLAAARLWWPVRPPPNEMRGKHGGRHSKRRDSAAISHHYDVSNAFYEIVLGPSMAYTCAVYPTEDATLEQAQYEKFDLVARKLGLREGMRLLDVGCGWGGMVMHAAEHYGVRALGVTLSRKQAEWAQKAIAERGLTDLAEVRHADYRDVTESGFDAISSIGLTEHIGESNVPGYFRFLYDKLRPGARLLNHCITRPSGAGDARSGPFIDRYVFPDGELESPGMLATAMHDAGFELRHEENLREHYAKTLAAWCANLDDNYAEAVREVGEPIARVWRLYMAASRLAFERNGIQLHQLLGVRTDDDQRSGFPLRPDWLS